jgi:predicted transcriptional regulator/DNA-binding XRE family transcriptional regulator
MGELKGKVVEVGATQDNDATRKIGESLRGMRKMSGLTQAEMAKRLNVGQAAVSKVESGRADMQVSTLQKYVEALGGTLRVNAAFSSNNLLSLRMLSLFDVELNSEDQLILPMFADDVFQPQRDVVLSIRPKYSSRILAGEKTVELRRRFPASAPRGTIAYIYSTSPERAMVGVAEIEGVKKLAVNEIWDRYSSCAFIEKPDFDKYFEGLNEGFALEFGNVRPFVSPMSLSELRERFAFEPPQSFLYAKQDLRRALKDEYTIVPH